ncbi:MAG: alanine racemase, partial [Porticoccaceae bacterium]|nr:alanine racemase [Porticoccaceae bacterium]
MARPTEAIIDRQALRDNLALVQTLAADGKTMPMVKANAYGHGAIEVSKALSDVAPAFGVACIEEALVLRDVGIKQPILLLEGTFSADEVSIAAENNFWLMVENDKQKNALLRSSLKQPINIWLGVDTGMHRLGFNSNSINKHYRDLSSSNNVANNIVLASHFSCADNIGNPHTRRQIDYFQQCLSTLDNSFGRKTDWSLANSAAVLAWPETHGSWQRPGYMIYGNSPFNEPQHQAAKLTPAMTFQSAVISIREIDAGESVGYTANWTAKRRSTIATITAGYGDGYPRQAPNGTPVLINGHRCPLVGRVSMDMIT